MTTESPGLKLSRVAAADLSTKQYYGVYIDSAGLVALAGVGVPCIGVLQNKPAAGEVAEVMVLGITKFLTASVIAPGAKVAVDAAGKAKTASSVTADASGSSATAATTGSHAIGIALNTANSASGDLIPVMLTHMGAVPATAA